MTPAPEPGRVEIAIAILRRADRLLVRRRRADEHLPDLWEFPGGKIRQGEPPHEAAAREVREEMGIEAAELVPLDLVLHDYPDRRVRLHVFEGSCRGDPRPPDGALWAWVTAEELALLPIPEANRSLVARLAARAGGGRRGEDTL